MKINWIILWLGSVIIVKNYKKILIKFSRTYPIEKTKFNLKNSNENDILLKQKSKMKQHWSKKKLKKN